MNGLLQDTPTVTIDKTIAIRLNQPLLAGEESSPRTPREEDIAHIFKKQKRNHATKKAVRQTNHVRYIKPTCKIT